MTALGQKQTFAPQKAMSALPPIATAKADFRTRSCLLYSRKRTCAVHQLMSALGQKGTSPIASPTTNAAVAFLNVRKGPASIEISLRWCIQAKVWEPEFVWHRLHPVTLLAARCGRSEIHIHRTVCVFLKSLGVGGHFGFQCFVAKEIASVNVVHRHCPELLHWRIGRDAQTIRLTTVKPVAVLVAIGRKIDRPYSRGLCDHRIRCSNRLIEPVGTLIQFVVVVLPLIGIEHQRNLPASIRAIIIPDEPLLVDNHLGDFLTEKRGVLQ